MVGVTHPNLLTAPYPTDGCSLSGWHLDADRARVVCSPVPTARLSYPWGAIAILAEPIPPRFAGRRDRATGETRVVVLDDGMPPVALADGLFGRPFDWGPTGSRRRARRLAYTLLADEIGADGARTLAWRFAEEVVTRWPRHGWAISAVDLGCWAQARGWGR